MAFLLDLASHLDNPFLSDVAVAIVVARSGCSGIGGGGGGGEEGSSGASSSKDGGGGDDGSGGGGGDSSSMA